MTISTSFVRDRDLWAPERTGQYGKDCQRGREYADQLIAHISKAEAPQDFLFVMKAMINKQTIDGVEAGFLQRIGEMLVDR